MLDIKEQASVPEISEEYAKTEESKQEPETVKKIVCKIDLDQIQSFVPEVLQV
jgi:hypothetical protein